MSGVAETTSRDLTRGAHAPAKLNLFLHVGARRPDGYHALESLVVFAVFGDHLRLEPSPAFSLVRTGPFAAALPARVDEDLTTRAVLALARLAGRDLDFTITLEKNIPVAAGLGGGSADAAAAIRLVCREWGVDPADPGVGALAEELGADVPMCLYGRPAWAAGIGERVAPVAGVPDFALLLVNPAVPLSTAEVFGAFTPDGGLAGTPPTPADLATRDTALAYLARQRNDLAGPAQRLCPVIADVLAVLARLPGSRLARMSGSGPTCFAIFETEDASLEAARELGASHPDWWVQSTRLAHSEL